MFGFDFGSVGDWVGGAIEGFSSTIGGLAAGWAGEGLFGSDDGGGGGGGGGGGASPYPVAYTQPVPTSAGAFNPMTIALAVVGGFLLWPIVKKALR